MSCEGVGPAPEDMALAGSQPHGPDLASVLLGKGVDTVVSGTQTWNDGEGRMVETRRIELPTFALRTRRSPS
jgi:hypothetical protein